MNRYEVISGLFSDSDSGVVSTKQVTEAGVHRGQLKQCLDENLIQRVGRGLYMTADSWEDELYLLQRRFSKGIFSHETALYLLGYSDRTPSVFTMTFPRGYHSPSLRQENVSAKYVLPELYPLGVIQVDSPCGNPIRIYNIERSLCDALRGTGCDIQVVNAAMKRYALSNDKDIRTLLDYATALRVKPKILRYMEVLL